MASVLEAKVRRNRPSACPVSVFVAKATQAAIRRKSADRVDVAPRDAAVDDRRRQRRCHAQDADAEIEDADLLFALQQVVGLDRHHAGDRRAADRFDGEQRRERPRPRPRGNGHRKRLFRVRVQGKNRSRANGLAFAHHPSPRKQCYDTTRRDWISVGLKGCGVQPRCLCHRAETRCISSSLSSKSKICMFSAMRFGSADFGIAIFPGC